MLKEPILKVENWANKYKLKFNKSNFAMIKIGKNITHIPKTMIGKNNIKHKTEIRYLGIIFDKKFSFIPHVYNVCKRFSLMFHCSVGSSNTRHIISLDCNLC